MKKTTSATILKIPFLFLSFLFVFLFNSCTPKTSRTAQSIAVFIPGIIADSPTYEKVSNGVSQAVTEYNASKPADQSVKLTVIEAGTNQAEWGQKLTALAATGSYSVIISSNPSLPELCDPISAQFPDQKFILLDAYDNNNNSIASVSYDQRTQAFLSGYISGLVSKSHKLGLIAAQEYPIMNTILYPYYAYGAKAANNTSTVDFRIVGNWYDASKGAELARAMANTGIDVILPICGGASQGVIATAKERGLSIAWFDENGFDRAPGTIISCTQIKQDVVAKEMTLQFLAGKTPFGTARVVGTLQDGYMEFITDNKHYIDTVPAATRSLVDSMINRLKTGTLLLPQNLPGYDN